MNTILALLSKETTLFLKDKVAVVMTFVVPFVLISIMGSIFGGLGGDGGPSARVKLAVYAENPADPLAQILVEALQAEESLEIVSTPPGSSTEAPLAFDATSLRQGIVDRHYNFALHIPADFVKTDSIGLKLALLRNPRNEIETQMINGLTQKAIFTQLPRLLAGQFDDLSRREMGNERYDQFLDGIAAALSLGLDVEYDEIRPAMGLRGLVQSWLDTAETATAQDPATEPAAATAEPSLLEGLLEIQEDQVYGKEVRNPELTRIVGGYAVMFLLFAVTGSSTSLFEERNEGIFARLLSMPVRRHHILWSKYLFNALLGIFQTLVLFITASLLFDLQIFPNLPSLLAVCILVSLACTACGMFLASVSKTTAQAQGFGTLLILTMSSLGGAWWPIEMLPDFLEAIGKCTIVYWGVQGFLGALWEARPIAQLLPILRVLLAIALVLNALSLWRVQKGDLFR